MQLGYLRLDWQSLAIIFGAGAVVAIGLFVLRRILGWILGPIFVYETTRLARKGHTFWLRCLFAMSVLGMLYVSAPKVKVLSIPTAETRRALAETPIQLDNPYPLAFAAHMWFIGNLGLFLSVVCASTNRAMSLLIVLIIGFMVSTWTMTYFAERTAKRHRSERALAAERLGGAAMSNNTPPVNSIEQFLKPDWIDGYANPIQVWWRLSGHSYAEDDYWDDRTTHPRLHFLAAVAYAAAGYGLYELAWLRFRKEGSRG